MASKQQYAMRFRQQGKKGNQTELGDLGKVARPCIKKKYKNELEIQISIRRFLKTKNVAQN